MAAFVEDPCYTSIRLLTSSIPYLELNDMLIVNPHYIISKLNTNRHIVVFMEGILNQSDKYARFTNTYKHQICYQTNFKDTYDYLQWPTL